MFRWFVRLFLIVDTSLILFYVQGAPENVLARCTKFRTSDGGSVDLTDTMRKQILAKVNEYGTGKLVILNNTLSDPFSFK